MTSRLCSTRRPGVVQGLSGKNFSATKIQRPPASHDPGHTGPPDPGARGFPSSETPAPAPHGCTGRCRPTGDRRRPHRWVSRSVDVHPQKTDREIRFRGKTWYPIRRHREMLAQRMILSAFTSRSVRNSGPYRMPRSVRAVAPAMGRAAPRRMRLLMLAP